MYQPGCPHRTHLPVWSIDTSALELTVRYVPATNHNQSDSKNCRLDRRPRITLSRRDIHWYLITVLTFAFPFKRAFPAEPLVQHGLGLRAWSKCRASDLPSYSLSPNGSGTTQRPFSRPGQCQKRSYFMFEHMETLDLMLMRSGLDSKAAARCDARTNRPPFFLLPFVLTVNSPHHSRPCVVFFWTLHVV